MSQNPPFIAEAIVEPYPGLFQEWYADRRIVAYRPTVVNAALLDAWSLLIDATIQAWDPTRPYLALHDIGAPGVTTLYGSMTSYDILNIGVTKKGKVNAEHFFNERPGFIARVAISFNMMLSGHIGKALLNHYTDKHPAVQYKSYYNRDKSLQWLLTHLDDKSQDEAGAAV